MVSAAISEPAMAKHIVVASGLNIFPSICSSVKSGSSTTTMIRTAKTMGLATSAMASYTIVPFRVFSPARSDSSRAMFSVTTIDASTTMPSASARPPRLIRFAVTPCQPIRMKVMKAVKGSASATMTAPRKLPRNMNSTSTTKMPPCIRALETVSMHAWISEVRS